MPIKINGSYMRLFIKMWNLVVAALGVKPERAGFATDMEMEDNSSTIKFRGHTDWSEDDDDTDAPGIALHGTFWSPDSYEVQADICDQQGSITEIWLLRGTGVEGEINIQKFKEYAVPQTVAHGTEELSEVDSPDYRECYFEDEDGAPCGYPIVGDRCAVGHVNPPTVVKRDGKFVHLPAPDERPPTPLPNTLG